MLGLTQEICGAHFCVDTLIGNDKSLRWAGDEIDSHTPEKLSLGLSYIGVAWAHDHGHRSDALGTKCQGGNCLHTSHAVDLIRTTKMHGSNDSRTRLRMIRG